MAKRFKLVERLTNRKTIIIAKNFKEAKNKARKIVNRRGVTSDLTLTGKY